MNKISQVPAAVDPARPAPARIYDYLLKGANNFLGDLRGPDYVLELPDVRALIDFSQPTGLLMTAVMHFVGDEWDPWGLLERYLGALAPGSYLSLSHLTDDQKPPLAVKEFCRVFDGATEQVHFRSKPDVDRLFSALEIVPPPQDVPTGSLCHPPDSEAADPPRSDTHAPPR